jgi:hypothetical protein
MKRISVKITRAEVKEMMKFLALHPERADVEVTFEEEEPVSVPTVWVPPYATSTGFYWAPYPTMGVDPVNDEMREAQEFFRETGL